MIYQQVLIFQPFVLNEEKLFSIISISFSEGMSLGRTKLDMISYASSVYVIDRIFKVKMWFI